MRRHRVRISVGRARRRERQVHVDGDGVGRRRPCARPQRPRRAHRRSPPRRARTATTCTRRPSWTYSARQTSSVADPLDPHRARGRGSCSSGGSAPPGGRRATRVSTSMFSSARIGPRGNGQATSWSICSGWSPVGVEEPGGELLHRGRDLGARPIDVRTVEAAVPDRPRQARRSPGSAAGSTRSAGRASRAGPSDGSGPSSRATTIGSCSSRRCWATKMRSNASGQRWARRRGRTPRSGRALAADGRRTSRAGPRARRPAIAGRCSGARVIRGPRVSASRSRRSGARARRSAKASRTASAPASARSTSSSS